MLKTFVKTVVLALAVVGIPSAAYAAYGVENADGYGNVTVNNGAALGWNGSATWRAKKTGRPVYVSGKVIYNSYTDHDCGRISANAYTGFITRSIQCVKTGSPVPSSDAAGIRLCTDISGAPDPCGSYRRINY